ncbi:MAG: hypothetical protein JST00_07345 [Deltaproteobacteria bacterium]|nr:hypothetical protein [Deltaproteobacteria bacterium]
MTLGVVAACAGDPPPAPIAPPPPRAGFEAPEPPPRPLVAGGPCVTEGKEKCLSETDALACHDGAWDALTCRGGCTKVAGEDQCTQTAVKEKEACNLRSDFTCHADGAAMMTCVDNKWTLAQRCEGDRKCKVDGKKVVCDNSLASAGDVCREENDYACALPEKKSALVCRQGKLVLASLCRGPKGCRIGGDAERGFKVECDDSVAMEGDTCDKEGHFSCAMDGSRILACKGGKLVADDKCKRREKCSVRGEVVGCF